MYFSIVKFIYYKFIWRHYNYAGFSIIVVIVDGSVKPVIVPQEGALPWDVPLPN